MSLNWNPERGANEAAEQAAAVGFRICGDAGLDDSSTDYAMFSDEGNTAVATMVDLVRHEAAQGCAEHVVLATLKRERSFIAKTHPEVGDTMVRETIAYALDTAWGLAFGHRFPYEEF